MEKITTEKVMEKLDMFQSIFGKIDQFGWWDLERITADVDTQFTSTEFKEECQTCGVHLKLEAPEHQESSSLVYSSPESLLKLCEHNYIASLSSRRRITRCIHHCRTH